MLVPVGNKWVGSAFWVTKCKWATSSILVNFSNLKISGARWIYFPSEFCCAWCTCTADCTAFSISLRRLCQKSPQIYFRFPLRQLHFCVSALQGVLCSQGKRRSRDLEICPSVLPGSTLPLGHSLASQQLLVVLYFECNWSVQHKFLFGFCPLSSWGSLDRKKKKKVYIRYI